MILLQNQQPAIPRAFMHLAVLTINTQTFLALASLFDLKMPLRQQPKNMLVFVCFINKLIKDAFIIHNPPILLFLKLIAAL